MNSSIVCGIALPFLAHVPQYAIFSSQGRFYWAVLPKEVNKAPTAPMAISCGKLLPFKSKSFPQLIAVGAVGVEAHCILGTDEWRRPSLSVRCLIFPWFEKGTRLLLD